MGNNEIGYIIRELRNKKNISQAELAKILDISPSMIAMIEQNNRKPNDDVKKKICNFFNVSMDYLMGVTSILNPKELIEKELYTLNLTEEEFDKYIGTIIKTHKLNTSMIKSKDIKEKLITSFIFKIYLNYLKHNPYTVVDNIITMSEKEYNELIEKMEAHTNKIDHAFLNLLASLDKKNIIHNYEKNVLNMEELPTIEIPILGTVKAGYNYLAQENWIGTIDVDKKTAEGNELFALIVKGDSMFPTLMEKDIVIVKKQNDFENGDIVVALINGDEATIKKGKKSGSNILLQPLNPTYEPLIYTEKEIKSIPVQIIGVVKEMKRKF